MDALSSFLTRHEAVHDALFICHASYESERAIQATDVLLSSEKSLDVCASILIATSDSLDSVAGYRECFETLAGKLAELGDCEPLPIVVSRPNLVGMTRAIHEKLTAQSTGAIGAIVVDASVFPKDRLWMILDYFNRAFPLLPVYVTHTEPEQYATEVDTHGWLSKGVKRLIRVPGFNGHQNPSKKTLLVLIVGHETERTQITIKNTEPHKIVLVGEGSRQHGTVSPMFPESISSYMGTDYAALVDTSGSVIVGARDYEATQKAIEELYRNNQANYNLIVAGNGTKFQSIGALLACQNERSIASIYAEPQIYNAPMYSRGISPPWILELK